MKMRVLGFSWDTDALPKAVPAATVFDRIEVVSGQEFGEHIAAVTKVNHWWVGVMIKIRDAKNFTKMRKEKGVVVFSAEPLKEGERLAEANFFVAHDSNGHGLYSYHYLSGSLISDFGTYCARQFQDVRRAKKEEALAAGPLTTKQKKSINKSFNGRLLIEQVGKGGGFADRIRTLAEINKLDVNLVSFEMKKRSFRPLTQYAKKSKLSITFGLNAPLGVVAGAIEASMDLFEDAKVKGKDIAGLEQTYRMYRDAQIFDEYDYDESMHDLELRFDDLATSIKCSPIITKMQLLADTPAIKTMLGIP